MDLGVKKGSSLDAGFWKKRVAYIWFFKKKCGLCMGLKEIVA